LGIVDQDGTPVTEGLAQTLNQTGIFTVINFDNKTQAMEQLKATNIRAFVVFPQNFTANITAGKTSKVSLTVDGTQVDVANLIGGTVKEILANFSKQLPSYKDPIITVDETLSYVGQQMGYKESLVPGMLCYPLLFSSMVVSTSAIVLEREKGTLKKIRASPIRPISMLIGKTLAALLQTAIAIAIMMVLAWALLAPKVNWNLPLLIPIFFLGSMNGIALGLIISCIGRAPQEASNAATTIAIVLQFFIGMYFPIDYLPTWMQQFGQIIPMTYAAQSIRSIMIRNATLSDLLIPIATLIISATILYGIGVLLYKRWVEK
jgi:ABC-2 type transport system permease protein